MFSGLLHFPSFEYGFVCVGFTLCLSPQDCKSSWSLGAICFHSTSSKSHENTVSVYQKFHWKSWSWSHWLYWQDYRRMPITTARTVQYYDCPGLGLMPPWRRVRLSSPKPDKWRLGESWRRPPQEGKQIQLTNRCVLPILLPVLPVRTLSGLQPFVQVQGPQQSILYRRLHPFY